MFASGARGWALRSLLLGLFLFSSDAFQWAVRHHRRSAGDLAVHAAMAMALAWLYARPAAAWLVYLLAWNCVALLSLAAHARLEAGGHLPPTADALLTYGGPILSIVIGVGAAGWVGRTPEAA